MHEKLVKSSMILTFTLIIISMHPFKCAAAIQQKAFKFENEDHYSYYNATTPYS